MKNAIMKIKHITELKSSSNKIGQLYPILLDNQGRIIDGEHRYAANRNWKKLRLRHIRSNKDYIIARIISNNVRRFVSSREKTELLQMLGDIHLKEGMRLGEIVYKIADETGMSYRWVAKYLPDKFKDYIQSAKRATTVARHATKENELTEVPKQNILKIQKYKNCSFVNILLEMPVYEQLENVAEKLQTTPDILITNALLLILKTTNTENTFTYRRCSYISAASFRS